MKTLLFITIILIINSSAFSQLLIEGIVTDEQGNPIVGANVYVKDTYSGSTTDLNGIFKFSAVLNGNEILAVSFMGFNNFEIPLSKIQNGKIEIKLTESVNSLNAVTITAGSFDASDEKKAITMRPLDIVTTPNSNGDIYGALNAMPGTQKVGEEGGLFVRGGEGYEAKTYMDGMLVQNPYSSTMPDVPSRGRFSPNLFTGTIFSTGGYTAEYGQALSSALILKSSGLPDKDITSVTLLSVGANTSITKRWKNTSVSFDADYTNLKPYFSLFKQEMDWQKAPEAFGGTLTFRQKTGNEGLIKAFVSFSTDYCKLNYPNYEINEAQEIILANNNFYMNSIYTDKLSDKWSMMTGVAFNNDVENIHINNDEVETIERAGQFRLKFTNEMNDRVSIKFGSDVRFINYMQDYFDYSDQFNYRTSFDEISPSAFIESEIKLSAKFAGRIGARMEYASLNHEFNLVPRISLARKTGQNSQISFAYGMFNQSVQNDYRKFNQDLLAEKAEHYILNYQFTKNDRVLRVEAYYKNYSELIKYQSLNYPIKESYNNSGKGYARGIDLFWRDRTSLKNVDYFISYSYIDTERNYRDYPVAAPPTYVAKHNLSVVYKHWINQWNTLLGLSYSVASGRPYYNPNHSDFLSDRTKAFQDLSMNASYLTTVFRNQAIFHLSVSNVFGFDNVYSYRYSPQPNEEMQYEAHPVKAGATRFVVLVFILAIK